MLHAEDGWGRRIELERSAGRSRISDPPYAENAGEVSVADQHDRPAARAGERLDDPSQDPVGTGRDRVCLLAAGIRTAEDGPSWIVLTDLSRRAALVLAVVPLDEVVVDIVDAQAGQFGGAPGPLQRAAEDEAGIEAGDRRCERPGLVHPALGDCRRLFIRNFELQANIGIHDFERSGAQRILVNVDLYVPLDVSTPKADELDEVVDYDFIRRTVATRLSKGHIHLQETLCDDILTQVLAHPKVQAARVSTAKPDVYPDCDAVGVEVFRSK